MINVMCGVIEFGNAEDEDGPVMPIASDRISIRYAMASNPHHQMLDLEPDRIETEPVLGARRVIAMDTAAQCFRTALTAFGVDEKGLTSSALPILYLQARRADSGNVRQPNARQ
jgi:hypothetical protein